MEKRKNKTRLARAAMTLLAMLFCFTGARAQQTLPYSYGFENNDLAADGWALTASNTSTGIKNANQRTGSYGFTFDYSTVVSTDAYLVSPVFSGATNGITVSFYAKARSASYPDHFQIGYTTDASATDASEFEYLDPVTTTTSWAEYTADLPARTVRVAIKYDTDNNEDGWSLYLDDFTFTAASSCASPTDLAIVYTDGATTATVTWSGEARSYNIDVNGSVTEGVTSPYTINNVAPVTTYTVKVQADCGDEQSRWVSTSFTTPCPESYAIPYAYGFEDAAGINCWTLSPASNMAVDDQEPEYAHSGNAFLFLNYTETPPQYVISPELSGIENGLHVEFWYSQYNNGIETFQVGYSTTDNDPANFTWGNEITASTIYQRFSANYPAETKYVAVKHTSDDQYYLFLDDFLFEESASVLEPTGAQATNATTTGATISWTAGGEETAWDIFVTDDATIMPDDTTTPTVSNTSENPYDLTNISSCTTYYVYVRAIKGSDKSAWSTPAIFNTKCEPMELPYSYSFEDASLPISWNTIVENTSYTGINVMAPSTSSTNQVLAFYMGTSQNPALVAVLPEVKAAYPLNGYQITFDACYANTSSGNMTAGKLGIGIMTDPADVSTFELIEEVNITDGFSTFGSHTVMLNSYTGNGQYIAIKDIYTQSGYVLVDNIEVTELPSCLVPTNLAVEGGKNAVVTWDGNADSFDVAYSNDNTVNPADNIVENTTENTFNLGEAVNLTEGDYYVWVRANCGTDGYSEWTAPVSFHVGYCTPNPTSHDGKGITGVSFGMGDYVVTNGDGSASLPASQPYYGDYTSMIGAVQAGVESTIAITTGTNNYPYTFVIWVDLDNSMSFEDSEVLYVGKATSGNGTLNATITIPATQTLGDYRMRIYGADTYFNNFYNNGTTNWNAAHDPCADGSYRHAHDYTLRVLEAPSCLPAADVTVAPESITTTSAVINWTNNSGEEATYTVMQGETVLTTTAVDSYTLEGLTSGTIYPAGTYTIISNCDETLIASVPAFSTPCDDITTLPWSEDFESYDNNTVPMCWDNSASTSTISTSSSSPNCIWGVVTVNDNNMIKMENYWAREGTALINTPTIVLPTEGVYQLTFDYAHNASCGAFAVKVSTDNGTTFTELASYSKGSGTSHTEPGDFTPATISLADYAGESIILQFFANANYGSGAIFVDNVRVALPPIAEITFAKEGFATYYNGEYDVVLTAGMKAHVVTDGSTSLTYAGLADGDTDENVVPAGTAVLLQVAPSTEDQTLPVSLVNPSAAAYTGTNLLFGSDEARETYGGEKYYKLTYSNDNSTFGWYWGAADGDPFESPAHKAWLALPASARSFLGLPDWQDATGITPVGIDFENGEWYTLQGLKIGKKPTSAGVYIHNGRKVVVK